MKVPSAPPIFIMQQILKKGVSVGKNSCKGGVTITVCGCMCARLFGVGGYARAPKNIFFSNNCHFVEGQPCLKPFKTVQQPQNMMERDSLVEQRKIVNPIY